MFLLIDNYDSFTYNLVHYLGELGVACDVRRNDTLSVDDAIALAPEAIVLSPGPCTPNEAGICVDLVSRAADTGIPLLGVCLGHQSIGQAFGGKVIRAPEPMHGKVDRIRHDGRGVFEGIVNPMEATRYHSLVIERSSMPNSLEISAYADDGMVMGIRHRELCVHGVQFHPESVATSAGHELLANFIQLATGRSVDGFADDVRAGEMVAL